MTEWKPRLPRLHQLGTGKPWAPRGLALRSPSTGFDIQTTDSCEYPGHLPDTRNVISHSGPETRGDETVSMRCEKCSKEKNTGSYYDFYYGTLVSSNMGPIQPERLPTTWTAAYRIAGSKRSWICRACVIRGFMSGIAAGVVLWMVVAAVLGLRWLYAGDIPGLLAIALVPVSLFCFIGGIDLIWSGIREIGISGESRAIEANRSHLQNSGYDVFFNHREYHRLKRATPSYR